VEQEAGAGAGEPAHPDGQLQVEAGQGPGVAAQVQQVAQVEGRLDEGHRRDGNLQDRPAPRQEPPVGLDRPQPVAEIPVEILPELLLLVAQVRRPEVVGASEGTQVGRQGGGVKEVAALSEDSQVVGAPAEAGPPEAHRLLSRGRNDVLLGKGDLPLHHFFPVGPEPRLVIVGMIPRLVAPRNDGPQRAAVLLPLRVPADDEKGDLQAQLVQDVQHPRHHDVEVAGVSLPPAVPVRLHVGPEVVEIQGEACEGLLPAGRGVHPAPSMQPAISCALRPARATSSLTFIVPLGICDEFAMKSPRTDVRVSGMTSAE